MRMIESQKYTTLFKEIHAMKMAGTPFDEIREFVAEYDKGGLSENSIDKIRFSIDKWQQFYMATGCRNSQDAELKGTILSPVEYEEINNWEVEPEVEEKTATVSEASEKEDLEVLEYTTGRGGKIEF